MKLLTDEKSLCFNCKLSALSQTHKMATCKAACMIFHLDHFDPVADAEVCAVKQC